MLIALEADRARVADLEAQILNLERSLSALRAEKALAEDRLHSYKYPVLTLPNEIVSEIFIHSLPPYPQPPALTGPFSPTLLTQICRKWRNIALATPALWRAIRITAIGAEYLRQQAQITNMWLSRSCSCLVSFEVDICHESFAPALFATITTHHMRLEYLKLFLLRAHLATIQVPMPALRCLDFRLCYSPNFDLLVCSDAPLLRTVFLDEIAVSHVILPWAQLTTLTLKPVYTGQCAPVLQQAPNLTHCELGLMNDDDDALPPDVQLPCLESLILLEIDDFPMMRGYLETPHPSPSPQSPCTGEFP
ncbi:F-box domain-containing protein [Mycena venus]|uniref:F-box domain-containing protein n=1 Tax=Mycena venus TaxID=2733690 RepID=A0A8H6X6T1_9AGAR|nr:F-box domain-containing protein [Mycena venus]